MKEEWCRERPFSDIYRHLPAVLPAISASLGAPCPTALYRNPEECREKLHLPQCSSCLFIFVDGLGYFNLLDNLSYAPFLRSLRSFFRPSPFFSCFPTTTAAAICSMGTGTCPGLTSIFGYTQINPFTGRISQMISYRGAPDPKEVPREPTVFSLLSGRGKKVATVGEKRFDASPLTLAALDGSRYFVEADPMEAAKTAGSLTSNFDLTYFYISSVDKAGHKFGCQSREWKEALEEADLEIRSAFEAAKKGTLLVVSADHGMVERHKSFDFSALPKKLMEGVRLVAGEQRDVMLYLEEGQDACLKAKEWEDYFDGWAVAFDKRHAVEKGIFGPLSPESGAYLGDVLVSFKGEALLDGMGGKGVKMPGVHGSWTQAEARIPLIAVLK
ncbi:MAG: alkaline phosphatase family protein [Aeriscardovia sp.]|nr:alkaline phosphatase family protein [Aeriscardovia sp.]